MRDKSIISTNQFVWMLFSIITSFTTLQIPGMLIDHVSRGAWISVIGAWTLDVLLAIVYAYMGLRFPGQNCVEYSISILGKYIGRIAGIIFPIFFLLVTSVLMRALANLISNLFLPKTPIEVILAACYILIAYGVRKGIEAIARTCEVLGPIYLISLITLFACLIPKVEIQRMKPVMSDGIYPILTGVPFILSYIGICIIMGMFIPICNKPKNGFLAKFIAVSLGGSIIIFLTGISIGVFGAEQAGNMINPGVQLARLVRVGDFVERMEIIWLMIAIAAGVMTSANLIWAFSLGISQIAGLRTYKPFVYPAVLIGYILSITSFKNTTELLEFSKYSYSIMAIFVETGLEMFLFIMALILKKRGKAGNQA